MLRLHVIAELNLTLDSRELNGILEIDGMCTLEYCVSGLDKYRTDTLKHLAVNKQIHSDSCVFLLLLGLKQLLGSLNQERL